MPYKDRTSVEARSSANRATKKWREKNPQYDKGWYSENPERGRSKDRKRYEQHREAVLAKNARWIKLHPEVAQSRASQRRARVAKASGACSVTQLRSRIALYGGLCWVPGCGKVYEAIDHVIPLAKGGSNWPSNLRPICKSHNSSKGSKKPGMFLSAVLQ
jgi:5-methylcytosine-specific restriction endonuclease McrA